MNTLYLKYRPESFEQIIGHQTIVKELSKRAKDSNFPKAMYFSGPSGVGKSLFGKIVGKHVLCESKVNGNPCGTCVVCQSIHDEQKLINFISVNCAEEGKDSVLQLIETCNTKVSFSKSKVRVVLLNEVQELSNAAIKSLLVALENPSISTYWLLTSMSDDKIPDAIKNRCTTYNLHPINSSDIYQRLLFICEKERVEHKKEILKILASSCNGSVRLAISLLERVIYSELWDEDSLNKELKLVSNAEVLQILTLLASGNRKFFQYKVDETLLKEIGWRIVLTIKYLNGVELTRWQLNSVPKDLTSDQAYDILTTVNGLLLQPYLTSFVIESSFLVLWSKMCQPKKEASEKKVHDVLTSISSLKRELATT